MLWLFKTALWIIFSHNYYICTQSFACRFMYHREIHECSQNQVFWFHPGFSAYVIHLFVNFSEIKLSINHLWYISYIDEKWCTWSVELSELLNMSENPQQNDMYNVVKRGINMHVVAIFKHQMWQWLCVCMCWKRIKLHLTLRNHRWIFEGRDI